MKTIRETRYFTHFKQVKYVLKMQIIPKTAFALLFIKPCEKRRNDFYSFISIISLEKEQIIYEIKSFELEDVLINEYGLLTFREWVTNKKPNAHGSGLKFSFHSWDKMFLSCQKSIKSANLKQASKNIYYLALNYSNQVIALFKIENKIDKLIFSENILVNDIEISNIGQKLVAILVDGGFGVWTFSNDKLINFQNIKTEEKLKNIKKMQF